LVEEGLEEYHPDMAMALSSIANHHRKNMQLDKAEEEFKEALGILREVAKKIPDAYLPNVAGTLYNMALLYRDKGDLSAAESAAEESLVKYRMMAKKSHEAFDKNVADAEKLLAEIRAMK
jgi:tetratricopeptide (TPR) repeat protein